jgi:hypothetical protein
LATASLDSSCAAPGEATATVQTQATTPASLREDARRPRIAAAMARWSFIRVRTPQLPFD